MVTVLLISACSVLTIVSLAARVHKNAFPLIRGHNALFDVLFTICLATFMAASGSLTGMMISAVTGVMLSGMLIFSSRLLGGAKVSNSSFVWYKPTTWFKGELKRFEPTWDFGWNTKMYASGV